MGCLLSSNTGPGVQEAVLPTAPADGTSSASDWGQRDGVKPTWTQKVLCSGADKDIFAGTYQGKSVAICVSKSHGGGWRRIQNEIKVFKALGTHPNIITMHSSGLHEGSLYMVLEVVDPIGFDLDRLKNTYSFAGQTVPSSLMARIVLQLVSALGHMHNKNIIHMDLKTENVLVDGRHNAKLIDMGIAGAVGRRECLRAGYLAPELCEGIRPLSAKVDSWGLGVILHQVYQNQWKLLTNAGQVEMLPGRPATQRPMERPVRDAMFRLLEISPSRRWHLRELQDCEWLWESAVLESAALEAPEDWHKPAAGGDAARRFLRRYVSKLPMPNAMAVYITYKNHSHLIGLPISALRLSSGLGVTVLLIGDGRECFESRPGADTPIRQNSWVYFGVPQGEGEMALAVEGLERVLATRPESPRDKSHSPGDFRAFTKDEVVNTGKLVEFTVEFDCFTFPKHIGEQAIIGVPKQAAPGGPEIRALDLRRVFNVNLVGIQRMGEAEPEWFPRASAVVRPDDLGLVVRLPCLDGSTQPTLTDADLESLMDEELFNLALPARKSVE